jgi:uncharacterized membrane protein (UPF0127 family)
MIAQSRSCARATAVVLALAAAFFVLILPASALPRSDLLVETASSQFRFEVEVADDPAERAEGLMYRETMADNAGMLFLYPAPQQVQFWMKNTPMSLDIVFVRSDGTIARIAERTTPFSEDMIPSGEKVSAVLEVKAGMMHQLGVRVGDRLKHPTYFP